MDLNVGGPDRTVRLLVGAALLVLGGAGYLGVVELSTAPVPPALASMAAILFGLVLFATGVARKCPLNRALGIDTYRREERDPPHGRQ